MLQTIQGIDRNGKIELAEIPQDIMESQVFVTFFKPESVWLVSLCRLGCFQILNNELKLILEMLSLMVILTILFTRSHSF